MWAPKIVFSVTVLLFYLHVSTASGKHVLRIVNSSLSSKISPGSGKTMRTVDKTMNLISLISQIYLEDIPGSKKALCCLLLRIAGLSLKYLSEMKNWQTFHQRNKQQQKKYKAREIV